MSASRFNDERDEDADRVAGGNADASAALAILAGARAERTGLAEAGSNAILGLSAVAMGAGAAATLGMAIGAAEFELPDTVADTDAVVTVAAANAAARASALRFCSAAALICASRSSICR